MSDWAGGFGGFGNGNNQNYGRNNYHPRPANSYNSRTVYNQQRFPQVHEIPHITNSYELENYIRRNENVPSWDMKLLHETIREVSKDHNLNFEWFCASLIQLSREGDAHALQKRFNSGTSDVRLTRREVSILLANAFLSRLNFLNYESMLNLNGLYSSRAKNTRVKKEKLKCLIYYLITAFDENKNGHEVITYKKVSLGYDFPQAAWNNNTLLSEVGIESTDQSMANAPDNYAQVDFANRKIGGGVLSNGSLQEEIKFITCPELLPSKLFIQMDDTEAIIIEGARTHIVHSGYRDEFTYVKVADLSQPRRSSIIAIDALDFSKKSPYEQFDSTNVFRELKKAYVGFKGTSRQIIATGNWGGGAFKGDAVLKFKIQWLAASLAGKKLVYYPYKSYNLAQQITSERDKWLGKTIGELYVDLIPESRSQAPMKRSSPETGHISGFSPSPPKHKQSPKSSHHINQPGSTAAFHTSDARGPNDFLSFSGFSTSIPDTQSLEPEHPDSCPLPTPGYNNRPISPQPIHHQPQSSIRDPIPKTEETSVPNLPASRHNGPREQQKRGRRDNSGGTWDCCTIM
ncbi:poly(ADP-ribose) glycohydrolase-like isoform X2 [Neocloeon triangulifer]|uniref:poly(ADP-ribose) glycohydrolase-like isoform X2 n=1 Tax=Neocloeon triangulifer TaxID=2078957 RepID=UPI00286EE80E|nr:poly(ADP-ribose) glycohydrolase-like isoform X2 [Neocloeon triangulifer]